MGWWVAGREAAPHVARPEVIHVCETLAHKLNKSLQYQYITNYKTVTVCLWVSQTKCA